MRKWYFILWPPLLTFIIFLVIWHTLIVWLDIDKWILPTPYDVIKEGIAQFHPIWDHTKATLHLTVFGFLSGTCIGIIIGVVIYVIPFLKFGLYPLLVFSQNIPTIALAPLLFIWFGFGMLPKVIVITIMCFFPVAVATLDGLTYTDENMRNYMRMIGASRYQILTKLEFPHSIPTTLSGVKIAATYSVMGAVIAEWLGADKGIGYYLMLQKASYRTDRMFVAIFIIALLSLSLFCMIVLLENIIIRSKPRSPK